jgi:hypothetical protein
MAHTYPDRPVKARFQLAKPRFSPLSLGLAETREPIVVGTVIEVVEEVSA